jgi:hypothetical protein
MELTWAEQDATHAHHKNTSALHVLNLNSMATFAKKK